MNISHSDPNFARLAFAADRLAPLLDRIVFVGGCITGLLITDAAAAPVRPTIDVDAIVSTASYPEYAALESEIRELGFEPSLAEGSPICRWKSADLILDLMPTDSSILGFSNAWYGRALENAQIVKIGRYEIRVITAPYFLATKLEAFHGRGKNDYASHDLEDIITIIDGRQELITEVTKWAGDLTWIPKAKSFDLCWLAPHFAIRCPAIYCPMQPANSESVSFSKEFSK